MSYNPLVCPRPKAVTLSSHRHNALIVFTLAVTMLTAVAPVSAGAVGGPPPNRQRLLEARAGELAQQRNDAEERLERVQADVREQSTRLDALVDRQQVLQTRLNSRALGMYRGHHLDFVDVLTNSASFGEFATRMDLLTRMNVSDAQALVELQGVKIKTARTSKDLLVRQQQAAAALRRIQAAENSAQRELAQSRAAYAAYRARLRTGSVASTSASAAGAPAQAARPSTSGGGWKTGVASHYGSGSYGRKTADGTTIGPDSMIVAHKTLPFGTLVQFQYRGQTCVARVADRGPYTPGRMWDLGPGVIRVLGFNGVDTVRYRIVGR